MGMTLEQFEGYAQEYLELVNSKYEISYADFIVKMEELKTKAPYKWMMELMECVRYFGPDKTHNEELVRGFEILFEHCFNPPQLEFEEDGLDDVWLREFQAKYLIFYERYYLTDQDLAQAMIDIVCRRNYQIWDKRVKLERSKLA